ncbi:hypothetical protein WA026_011258 [Henosepilachna vigintioctopunctata]|uniref:Apple domain-containing protein n=1 Tax=Henosepilachna vigintioctopunctata TaxID=420089 RepID=A0AAW1U6C2_9CUCU
MLPKVLIRISKVFVTIWVLNIKFVNCIKIENQLKVITNDCYERLAIGQRLKPQDIYKKVDANTVPKCQKECTIEGDNCKAFSYGIAVKGNSTCQLGKNFIQETADLQPIGTIADVDFDLYIKKLGCKLVVDPHVNKISKPNFNGQFLHSSSASSESFNQQHISTSKPSYPSLNQHGIKNPDENPTKNNESSSKKPLEDVHKPTLTYGLSIPNIETVHPSNGYKNTVKKPTSNSKFTQYVQNGVSNNDVQHVQGSLVSISTGPLSYLHPVHEILIGKNPYLYGQTKPYRPPGNIPEESNYFNDKVGPYHNTNNMRPYDRYKDGYGSSNEYFNEYPETYRDYSKYKNPNNLEATRNPEYDYNRFQKPGHSSYHQEIPHVPSSNDYKVEIPDRKKYNQHSRPFSDDSYDHYHPQQTNNFEYEPGKFTHEKDKPSYNTHRGYDDKRKRNPYDSEASKYKPKLPLETPNDSFGSYNGGRYPMTSNVYKTNGPNRLSDSYDNKPGYSEPHKQFFDERYPPRPIDYDYPQYDRKPFRPQHFWI